MEAMKLVGNEPGVKEMLAWVSESCSGYRAKYTIDAHHDMTFCDWLELDTTDGDTPRMVIRPGEYVVKIDGKFERCPDIYDCPTHAPEKTA